MTRKAQPKDETLTELRARVAKAPLRPGIYKWLGKNEEVLYIGKAKNLRNRLKSYVQKANTDPGPWKTALIGKIADVDWTVTETEIEALILETNLIKEIKPKYNVMMKDDKNYVYVRVTVKDSFPGFSVVRLIEDDGAKYFGPFLTAYKINRTLDMLHTVYDFKACKRSIDALNKDSSAKLKPCLDAQIGKCCGLCAGKVRKDEYQKRVNEVIRFFKGDRKGVQLELQKKMEAAAQTKRFEKAAILRDTLAFIQSLDEQQIVSDTSGANTDAIAVALQSGRSQVVVLREREGKMIGERSYALTGQADTMSEVLGQFLPQYYTSVDQDIPEVVLCSEEMEEKDVLESWLTAHHGRKVEIIIPERGKKSRLLIMAEANAKEKVRQSLAKWEATSAKVEEALAELKNMIHLSEEPKRIECYDISHHGGTETVGSMVVFMHGKADNKQYRSFTIRTIKKGQIDDYKALKEVLTRRLRHLKETQKQEEKQWEKEGVTIGKALKKEQERIEEIHKEKDIDYHDYIVARSGNEIVGFGSICTNKKKITEMKSLWVCDEFRGGKLGHALTKKLLNRQKNGKVYITIDPKQEEYYAHLGFRYVIEPPESLAKQMKWINGIIMVYIVADHKEDASLNTKPDLLVIDGGKGQLSTVSDVLNAMQIEIPVIGLAKARRSRATAPKREEEVFVPNESSPVAFKKDSEGLFLLMRMRDEAHRFANRHRERRMRHGMME